MENNNAINRKIENTIFDSRSILIYGEINQELAKDVSAQLLAMQAVSDEAIKIFINSQGGHVEAGDTIHDMIKFIKPKVYIIGTGWVASAGVSIYLAAEKKNRFALENTRFMIHQPLGGAIGQATDIEIEAEEILKIKERINVLISKASGQELEKVRKDTDRNFWMSSKEAKDYGLVNKILKNFDEIK